MRHYSDLFTWQSIYGEHVLLHNDGACSLLIEWSGIDIDLKTQPERRAEMEKFYGLLNRQPPRFASEWHLWRELDDGPAQRYRAYSKALVRGGEFAVRIRNEVADHLAPLGISNTVALVLVRLPEVRFSLRAKRQLLDEARAAEDLLTHARGLVSTKGLLPAGCIATTEGYAERITQSAHRAASCAVARRAWMPRAPSQNI